MKLDPQRIKTGGGGGAAAVFEEDSPSAFSIVLICRTKCVFPKPRYLCGVLRRGLSHPRTNTLFRNRWKRRRQLQRQTDGKGEELFK